MKLVDMTHVSTSWAEVGTLGRNRLDFAFKHGDEKWLCS